jgi:hypothetical protein
LSGFAAAYRTACTMKSVIVPAGIQITFYYAL